MNKIFKRFLNNESGNVIFLVALTLTIIIAIGGASIDFGRAYIIKAKMQQASDAAAIAAATMPSGATKAARTAKARKVFALNFPNGYMGSDANASDLVVTYTGSDADPTAIYIAVNDDISTNFIRVKGTSNLRINSEVGVSIPKPADEAKNDIILVLDDSGSMGFTDNLTNRTTDSSTCNVGNGVQNCNGSCRGNNCRGDQLKRSLNVFLDTLFGSADTSKIFYIGTVSYGTGVKSVQNFSNTKSLIKNNYTNGLRYNGGTDGGAGAEEGRKRIVNATSYSGRSDSLKYAIIMTDGENNPGQDNIMTTACTAMKNNGVTVYTIAFGLSATVPGSAPYNVLRNCAGIKGTMTEADKNKYARTAQNGDELDGVFSDISKEVRNLKVIK